MRRQIYGARGYDLLDETAAAGGRMFAQVRSRALSSLLSFDYTRTTTGSIGRTYANCLAEQAAKLRDPAVKAKLVDC